MATGCTEYDLCDICETRNKTNRAIKWCPECEEKLCDECCANHAVSKLLRNHDVIDIEQYRKLPKCVLAVKNICDSHDMKFTHFCQQHDKLCCPACFAGSGVHGKCTTLALQDVLQNAKTSVLLQSVEETLVRLKHNLRMVISDRQSNIQNLYHQRENILKDVKQIKEKIVKQLADFERNISDELDKTIKKNNRTLKSEIANIEERYQQVEIMYNESIAMKQYGSDLQIFMGSKFMENEVSKMQNNLQELVKKDNMKRVGIKLKWNTKVNEINEIIPSLGSVLEEETQMAVILQSDHGTQVHVMQPSTNKSLDDITFTLKSEFEFTGEASIYGCSLFQNGKVIFAEDKKKNIVVFKENGKKERAISISSNQCDVAIIDDSRVAVSTDDGVKVINIRTNSVKQTIDTGRCHGLEYYKGSLYCCVPGKGVLSVDLSTSTTTTVVQDTAVGGLYYCTVYNDRIYTTRSAKHTVTCYTMGGDKIWEFKHRYVIDRPLGIAVDKSSNVYVASYNNHSIVVFAPDGQRQRTLLTEKERIYRPRALHFDRSRNLLLVGNDDGVGLLFNIYTN